MEDAVRSRVEHAAAYERMKEIQAIVERINYSWEQGFLTKDEYVEKRKQLQLEMESLRPIDYDELIEAADLLSNFRSYWDECEHVPHPDIARQQLVAKIVERIFVHEHHVIGLVLHGDFAVLLEESELGSQVITGALSEHLREEIGETKMATHLSSHFGDDGVRPLTCTQSS